MCIESGVAVQLHTMVTAAVRDENGKLSMVITESKAGRQAWAADVFIDATGDGDLGAQAGCGFDVGRPEDGGAQPMSLIAVVCGIESDAVEEFQRTRGGFTAKQRLREEMERAGVSPSYNDPFLAQMSGGLFLLMANHIYGVSASDAGGISNATFQAREEIHRIVNALKKLGGPWSGLQIAATAPQIGIREGRRLHGIYTITESDLIEGKHHEDGICRVLFGIDVHSTNPDNSKGYESRGVSAKPYDIPVRALIARDVPGLIFAGRCISGDFTAHSSYRVTGNAAATGQAAGVLAALAATSKKLPEDISWEDIKATFVL